LNTDTRKFDSSQKEESRAQLADSSKACRKHRAFFVKLSTYLFHKRIQVRHVKQNYDPVWQQAQNNHESSYR